MPEAQWQGIKTPILRALLFGITVLAKVKESALSQEDKGAVAMLRLMLVTVVASYTIDEDLLSECQVCRCRCGCG